jgi:CubicO group peptidase (beta-lactamase class C family)
MAPDKSAYPRLAVRSSPLLAAVAVIAICTGCASANKPTPPGASADAATSGASGDAAEPADAAAPAPRLDAPTAPPTDGHDAPAERSVPDPVAAAACEAELGASWSREPLTTGLGSPSVRASYARVIGKLMSDFGIPGGAVAVAREGKLVLALGLGTEDVDQPAHADQLFRIASLSKQITATAILLLVERGQLALEDKVFAILGDQQPLPGATVNPRLAGITVRQLLQHTGGWNRDFEAIRDPMFASQTIAAAFGQPGPAGVQLVVRWMLDKPLTYAPGSTSCYSNFGYALLGRVIEQKTGMPYADFVTKNVLRPAGIRDMAIGRTRLELRADDEVRYFEPGMPAPSSVFPDLAGPAPWPYGGFFLEAMDAHGAWIASPIDMLRFQLTIDGRPTPADLIRAESRTAMVADPMVPSCTTSGGSNPADPAYWYGFGLQLNKYANTWHTGSLPGTATEDVTAANGFAWAAFFNRRPTDGAFWGRLDGDLWKALDGAGLWTASDLFGQYTAPTDWLEAGAYATEADRRQRMGEYPVRAEGRLLGGVRQYRARFAPLPTAVRATSTTDADCLALRDAMAARAAEAYALASLQWFLDEAGRRRYQATWTKGW